MFYHTCKIFAFAIKQCIFMSCFIGYKRNEGDDEFASIFRASFYFPKSRFYQGRRAPRFSFLVVKWSNGKFSKSRPVSQQVRHVHEAARWSLRVVERIFTSRVTDLHHVLQNHSTYRLIHKPKLFTSPDVWFLQCWNNNTFVDWTSNVDWIQLHVNCKIPALK